MENLEFEIEVTDISEAQARVEEIREKFGEVFVKVKISSATKGKIFGQLDNLAAQITQKLNSEVTKK